jgi:predicted transcriptional regulator
VYDRKNLYKFLYSKCDHNNVISMKQGDIARQYGISYQRMSGIIKEFIDLGMIEKNGHQYVVVYDPDRVPWDKFDDLRKRYLAAQGST